MRIFCGYINQEREKANDAEIREQTAKLRKNATGGTHI